jgi:hypothetical protein
VSSPIHANARIALLWHREQMLACRAVADVDGDALLLDLEDGTETHEELASLALDVLTDRMLASDAIGVDIYTVAPSELRAVRWTVRWYDRCRHQDGSPVLWVEEMARVQWCPRCEAPTTACRCDDERRVEYGDVAESLGLRMGAR